MIELINTFLSYFMVTAVFAVVMIVAVFAGIWCRKKSNAKKEAIEAAANNEDVQVEA